MLRLRCSSDASWSLWPVALGRAELEEASWSPALRCQKGRNHGGSLEFPIFRKCIRILINGWLKKSRDVSTIWWTVLRTMQTFAIEPPNRESHQKRPPGSIWHLQQCKVLHPWMIFQFLAYSRRLDSLDPVAMSDSHPLRQKGCSSTWVRHQDVHMAGPRVLNDVSAHWRIQICWRELFRKMGLRFYKPGYTQHLQFATSLGNWATNSLSTRHYGNMAQFTKSYLVAQIRNAFPCFSGSYPHSSTLSPCGEPSPNAHEYFTDKWHVFFSHTNRSWTTILKLPIQASQFNQAFLHEKHTQKNSKKINYSLRVCLIQHMEAS